MRFIVGRASCLPLNGLRSQARRPRYIQKSKSKLLLVLLATRYSAVGASPRPFQPSEFSYRVFFLQKNVDCLECLKGKH
jgi:hypothetical protein